MSRKKPYAGERYIRQLVEVAVHRNPSISPGKLLQLIGEFWELPRKTGKPPAEIVQQKWAELVTELTGVQNPEWNPSTLLMLVSAPRAHRPVLHGERQRQEQEVETRKRELQHTLRVLDREQRFHQFHLPVDSDEEREYLEQEGFLVLVDECDEDGVLLSGRVDFSTVQEFYRYLEGAGEEVEDLPRSWWTRMERFCREPWAEEDFLQKVEQKAAAARAELEQLQHPLPLSQFLECVGVLREQELTELRQAVKMVLGR